MRRQRTIQEKISCTGVGLHSGQTIRMELLPAPEDNGITFRRADVPGHPELKACIEHVVDTRLATTLGVGVNGSAVTVGTVEHLLSALAGVGVDNVQVLLDGPEVPVLDGSAGPFVSLLEDAGLSEQRKNRRLLAIRRDVSVKDGSKVARVSPAKRLTIECSIDFDHPLIPHTPYRFEYSEREFSREIARARTFGFLRDVEALRQAGLAKGGSLENAIVIDHYRVLNPEGLRFADEFVRHKVLDAIGDLSLLGMPIVGRVHLERSGHALNTDLVREVLSDERNYEIIEELPAANDTSSATDAVAVGAIPAVG